ncbi:MULTISPECIES: type II secretion system F family protein [Methylomonas]|uniref:type II secretion system F family protein n=1 Tax=Methylomonas TaxID=416 RepID=UPI00123215C0|nr:type II secretion system F family protein [Methylomonas rhizoryzae]
MSSEILLMITAAVMLAASALAIFLLDNRNRYQSTLDRRLNQIEERRHPPAPTVTRAPINWAKATLQRSGLERSKAYVFAAGVLSVIVGACGYLFNGSDGLLVTGLSATLAVYLALLWKIGANQRKLLEQIPGFIDHIVRIMAVGRSFDSALLQAIEDCPAPLSDALANVVAEQALGGDIVEALSESAEVYRLKELHLITLALRINQRYGGSIREMLENIIALIRRQEEAERELSAITGETRLSAWILGLMPSTLAGYMMITNPSYIGFLLESPGGMNIIYTSLGLQVFGGFVIWRMMRSLR